MGKGHVYQQQYYGGNGGDGMWMESQAHQTYAFHEEYKGPEYTHHMKQPSFTMENQHSYAHGGHSNGNFIKPGSGGYHHAYGGGGAGGGGKFSNGGGSKFNNNHPYGGGYNSSYSEESEHEEFESYSEDHEMKFQQHGHGGDHHGFYGNPPYEARMNRNMSYMGYNNKPKNGGHKYEWTAKGV